MAQKGSDGSWYVDKIKSALLLPLQKPINHTKRAAAVLHLHASNRGLPAR